MSKLSPPTVSTLPLAPVVVTERPAVSGYDYNLLLAWYDRVCRERDTLLLRYEAAVLRAEAAERALAEAVKHLDLIAPMVCPECGPHRAIDEDGCCVTCGADCALRGAADRREPRRP